MKNNYINKLLMLSIVLTLLSITVLSGTLSRYTSSTTGTGRVNVAQWTDIEFEGNSSVSGTFTFDLSETKSTNTNVVSTQIAPGDEGSFEVTFGPAEVAYSYGLTVNNINPAVDGNPNIVFYSDEGMTEVLEPDSGTVSLAEAQTGFTKTIYWRWAYSGGTDSDDTADGILNASLNFEINITATQIDG